jgi:hypothetical protein
MVLSHPIVAIYANFLATYLCITSMDYNLIEVFDSQDAFY